MRPSDRIVLADFAEKYRRTFIRPSLRDRVSLFFARIGDWFSGWAR
jgi:hypothetical protein